MSRIEIALYIGVGLYTVIVAVFFIIKHKRGKK
jgi:hypothetical protein